MIVTEAPPPAGQMRVSSTVNLTPVAVNLVSMIG